MTLYVTFCQPAKPGTSNASPFFGVQKKKQKPVPRQDVKQGRPLTASC